MNNILLYMQFNLTLLLLIHVLQGYSWGPWVWIREEVKTINLCIQLK